MKDINPRRSKQEWFDLITQCKQSGLSNKAWCQENGISIATFYYHAKELSLQEQEIVPVDMETFQISEAFPTCSSEHNRPNDVAIEMKYQGMNLIIHSQASGSVIYDTLKALRELC